MYWHTLWWITFYFFLFCGNDIICISTYFSLKDRALWTTDSGAAIIGFCLIEVCKSNFWRKFRCLGCLVLVSYNFAKLIEDNITHVNRFCKNFELFNTSLICPKFHVSLVSLRTTHQKTLSDHSLIARASLYQWHVYIAVSTHMRNPYYLH